MKNSDGTKNDLISMEDTNNPLIFFKRLQAITNKIYATSKVEEIMLGLSKDICHLFACDRLTLYAVSLNKMFIESKVKTGLRSFKHFALPISEKNIAGYVALTKRSINLGDVYDEDELKVYSEGLQFLKKVDERTGYHTTQMLVAPILNAQTGELLGVVQLINSLTGQPFSGTMEEGLKELCDTLALAFAQRLAPPVVVRSKYDTLVSYSILSLPELELAFRAARRKQIDIEDVLVNEFQVKLADIGSGLSIFFDVPYEPYKANRDKPAGFLAKFKRSFVEEQNWLLLEESPAGMVILSTDPDGLKGSRVVRQFFKNENIIYLVTTNLEFKQTVEQFFGATANIGEIGEEIGDISLDRQMTEAEEALIKRIDTIVSDAFDKNGPDIKIHIRHEEDSIVRHIRADDSLESLEGKLTMEFFVKFP